ncbi:hypothetical protein QWY31_02990 [Cytophagales bacterium LB-30]|uniref:Outer membrane protein beta-barrel domain-containing protein n=1 Tax=Shiella aurantiaca TaxID=3058365 RepID=A0ABT8F2C5_9BACT|nr:hypothetical protein [Shiella aurantiaca]MDN4164448.1 hypothetical protein [Shiella aurantiaca]
MQKLIVTALFLLSLSAVSMAQNPTSIGKIDYSFEFNDPNDAARLLVLAEIGVDGAMGNRMFVGDINLGAIARYSVNDHIDVQTKIRKSLANFMFDPAYRKNFEFEGVGTLFLSNKVKDRSEEVRISEKEVGNKFEIQYFNTPLPQRNSFGFNAGLSFKTVGINPTETYDPAKGDGYNGVRENVNFSTVSLIGGIQFKRINASVIKLKKYKKPRVFDNYVVMSFDGIFAPINTFTDGITGERVGDEIKSEGFATSLPFGARFTYNVYGSLPASLTKKAIKYTTTASIGIRPYLGFSFDFGIGVMLVRK